MSSNDDLTRQSLEVQQQRATRRLLAIFAVLWVGVCALAFVLMMGWV